MKYAVYVEGKAEMLFVADILSKFSNYNPNIIGFQCITLNSDDFEYVNFPKQGDYSSKDYYQIVNVNNDNLVISKLKKDIPNLVEQGFEIIIGLRDVFGSAYDSICKQQIIDMNLISQMHKLQLNQLNFENVDIRLHFAIMEYETWMIALLGNYIKSKNADPLVVYKTVGIDYSDDFEKVIYHPTKTVQKIYQSLQTIYGKHEENYLSFLSFLTRNDYMTLRNSGRCASYKSFLDSLLCLSD